MINVHSIYSNLKTQIKKKLHCLGVDLNTITQINNNNILWFKNPILLNVLSLNELLMIYVEEK
jgi:hypothetical protein